MCIMCIMCKFHCTGFGHYHDIVTKLIVGWARMERNHIEGQTEPKSRSDRSITSQL
jgi:hypothetical protein